MADDDDDDPYGKFFGRKKDMPSSESSGAVRRQPEMRTADPPSWSEWLRQKGQDVLMAAGAQPYNARKLSEGLTNVASITPMGSVLSLAELWP